MRINKAVLAAGTAVSLVLSYTGLVYAEDPSAGHSTILLRTVPNDVLDAQRGKAETVLVVTGLDGMVEGNVARNTVSGHNIITNGSFTNANGLYSVIQNSGNNVLIQNATTLLLDVH